MSVRPSLVLALAALATAVLVVAPAGPAAGAGVPPPDGADERLARSHAVTLALARQALREGRFPAAYGRFAALADAGHAPSAELSLVMWRHGREVFGSAWSATPAQVRRWTALAAERARTAPARAEADLHGE